MNHTEEQITVAAARELTKRGWTIISAHPPDGHGPFTIPMPSHSGQDIDRAGTHPDIVAIKENKSATGYEVLLLESKLDMNDLRGDIKKFDLISQTENALRFIGFRLQRFNGCEGINLDEWQSSEIKKLPIVFCFAYQKTPAASIIPATINGFKVIDLPIEL